MKQKENAGRLGKTRKADAVKVANTMGGKMGGKIATVVHPMVIQ